MSWFRKSIFTPPMSSKIENLIRLSTQTFLHRRDAQNVVANSASNVTDSSSMFHKLFSELMSMTHSLTGDDVGLPKLLQYAQQLKRHKATALYSGIHDGSLVSICIFILYPKSTIPLHSHPGMYGILKVLHGGVTIRGFTSLHDVDYTQPNVPKFLARESVKIMNEFSQPAIVTPENNLHEVANQNNEVAVFLDILSPKYENDNCYFSAAESKPGVCELVQIPCPSSFYTITVPFPLKSDILHLNDRPDMT